MGNLAAGSRFVGYSADAEEAPVTLQIMMRAGMDWLIASDMKAVSRSGVRSSLLETKIVSEPSLGLGYAFAGDNCAVSVGQELVRDFNRLPLQDSQALRMALEALANRVWQHEQGRTPMPQPSRVRSLLIGFRDGPNVLWRLLIGECSIAQAIRDKGLAGDEGNPAVFFAERYYDASAPIDDLIPLAAHVVLMASKFSSDVEGLEILKCKGGILTFYPSGSPLLARA